MSDTNRRGFLKQASLGVVGTAALSSASYAQVVGANERIQVAILGPGGMGMNHVRTLVGQRDVDLTHVCDVDANRLAEAVKNGTRDNRAPQGVTDMRRIVENRDVAVVFIATPDHWHAPASILALDAGKHVYVEKPCAHNIREGRLLIDAARRNRKICQVGTQSRSSEHAQSAMQAIREGAIGEVLAVRVWNSQLRGNIGRQKPSDPPAGLDYDAWVGPAPFVPFQRNRLHGVWRWWYNFGTGDMGNDGVHDLDIGRWGLGVETHPTTVTALGGKYFFDDDQEFPDTQTVIFEWSPSANGNGKTPRKKQLIFEQRIWTPYKMEGYENGDAFYGINGMLIFGKEAGWRLYGPRNKEIRTVTGSPNVLAHHRNFFECIRSGRRPNADIEIGHLSATLCHLGNIATRVRRVLTFDPKTEEVHNDKEAGPMARREYRQHWATPRGV
ncbi:MAG: Gfo/Idh/MocA family oxidoreductase [Gemmataceae bacterium]|nr:Gfo/Idh/MocA family oxidoreductase [Gemmataceae bacterium]MCI0742886.1 Gfo/Idh/MocA family oxidoreductase [Gemmataceae bacterium]